MVKVICRDGEPCTKDVLVIDSVFGEVFVLHENMPIAKLVLSKGVMITYSGVPQALESGAVVDVDLRDTLSDDVLRKLERLVNNNSSKILDVLNALA